MCWGYMRFKALNLSETGHLVLSSKERTVVSRRMRLYYGEKLVGEVVDTIGRVSNPLYIAELKVGGKELIGKELIGK